MSVIMSDIVAYGVVNMPEADGVTVGGAIDFSKRIEFDGTAISTLFDLVSSSASDTATKVIYLTRDSTGVKHNETLTTNGQTKVNGTLTAERLMAAASTGGAIAGLANPGGTTAVGDLALIAHTLTISAHTMQAGSANATTGPDQPAIANLQSGDGASVSAGMVLRTTGGTGANQIRRVLAVNPNGLGADVVAVNRNWSTVPDNTTTYEVGHGMVFDLTGSNHGVAIVGTSTQTLAISRLFIDAVGQVSGGSTVDFYEEIVLNNNNQSTAITSAAVLLEAIGTALPAGVSLNLALANALNNTATVANRQTAPSSITSFTSGAPPQSVSVPSPGNLPASLGAADASGAQKCVLQLVITAGVTSGWESAVTIRATGSSS